MSVYTVVEEHHLVEFLQDYDVGELDSFEGISAGIENTNYFVNTINGGHKEQYVLTIFEHHSFEELPYFLNIMAFMAEHNIPTAHPMPTKSNGYLKELRGKPAALVERLPGSTVDNPNVDQCGVMGGQLAKFHIAGQNYDDFRANDRDIDWMAVTYAQIKNYLPDDECELIDSELVYQNAVAWTDLPKSVIHADLFCDNAMFNGEFLSGIIDLYYACNAPMLYDLAVMVNDWCRTHTENASAIEFDQKRLDAMLSAYDTQRPLTDAEQKAWPAALRLAALRFFLSRLKDKHIPREGEMTQIKDPNVFKRVLMLHRQA